MSKYLILGLTTALITVLLLIGVGMMGLKVASKALEKKVSTIHIQTDVKTLQSDLDMVDSNLTICQPVLLGVEQLVEVATKQGFGNEELNRISIQIARIAETAAKCHKEKMWNYMLEDRGLSTKKQLAALGNSVFIAGRQSGYKFTEIDKAIFQTILEMQTDQLGREVVFDQVDLILPQLDTMLLQINKKLADIQKQL